MDSAGKAREGWPIQMGEIQAQAVAADVNGDGETEIIAADTRGNVAAFSPRGKEVWERHLASLVAQVGSNDSHKATLKALRFRFHLLPDRRCQKLWECCLVHMSLGASSLMQLCASKLCHDAPHGFVNLQGTSIGDIDGDGELEVVVGTTSGKIYALAGKTGQDTGPFPFETRGRIMAPVDFPSSFLLP